jgi:hypothetical protein
LRGKLLGCLRVAIRRYAPRLSERVRFEGRADQMRFWWWLLRCRSSSCDHKLMTKQENEAGGASSSKIERQVKLMKI